MDEDRNLICGKPEEEKRYSGKKYVESFILDNIEIKQSRINAFLGEIFYLNEVQNQALEGMIPMTQAIFDSIMERRDEVGPILEDMWMDVFLKYPEFAMAHTEKLAAKLEMPLEEMEISESAPEDRERTWNHLKKLIKEKYGDEL